MQRLVITCLYIGVRTAARASCLLLALGLQLRTMLIFTQMAIQCCETVSPATGRSCPAGHLRRGSCCGWLTVHPRIGTFIGHKGAVWQARLSPDSSNAATASADFTAYAIFPTERGGDAVSDSPVGRFGTHTQGTYSTPFSTITLSELLLTPPTTLNLLPLGAWRRSSEYSTWQKLPHPP